MSSAVERARSKQSPHGPPDLGTEATPLLSEDRLSESTLQDANADSLPPESGVRPVRPSSGHGSNLQAPSMRRNFTPLSTLGLGFSITNSWVGYLSCFGQNLAYAGPQSVIFGLPAAVLIQWIITLGLSEIASAFPTSGGQYHFVYILAPKKTRNFAAFVIGWMNLLGWSVALCSGVSVTTSSISGLVSFWDPQFNATGSQLYFIYVLTAVLSLMPLFLPGRWLPRILKASLLFSVAGFSMIFILVLILRKYSQPLSFITSAHLGTSGWSLGPGWMMGVGNSMYAFGSIDAVIHIAEEVKNPRRDVPLAMNLTLAIGFLTTFPLFLVMMLSVKDIEAVANAQLPYAELLYQATGDKILTTGLIVWVTIVLFTALIGQWVTCGRLAYAVARDHGLPFSEFFGTISDRFNFPVRTTLLALLFCATYGLLYLFNTTAFNSIITSAVLYLDITYAVPQLLLATQVSRKILPPRPFDLGRLGYVCNAFAPVLVAVMAVFICLPPQLPTTLQNMNYTPLVLVLLFLVILFAWYRNGRQFHGPEMYRLIQNDVEVS